MTVLTGSVDTLPLGSPYSRGGPWDINAAGADCFVRRSCTPRARIDSALMGLR
jgi:hypothetical protein